MTTAIIIGDLIALAAFVAGCMSVAKKDDDTDTDDDDHSDYAELRCVTKINDENIMKEKLK